MLELYQHEVCEDSAIVRRRLSELGLSYVVHNPREPGSRGGAVLNERRYEEMTSACDRDMYPIMIDDRLATPLHGEDEILDHLAENYS